MEITGYWQRLRLRAVLAAYFANSVSGKAELAELHARSEANTEIDQKTALMKAEFEALSQRLFNGAPKN